MRPLIPQNIWEQHGFRTKGEYVYWLRQNTFWTWKQIAEHIPGGTVGNCTSSYYYYVNRL